MQNVTNAGLTCLCSSSFHFFDVHAKNKSVLEGATHLWSTFARARTLTGRGFFDVSATGLGCRRRKWKKKSHHLLLKTKRKKSRGAVSNGLDPIFAVVNAGH